MFKVSSLNLFFIRFTFLQLYMKLKYFFVTFFVVYNNILPAQQTKDTMLSIYYKSNQW
jgi:hypothetical protein